MVQIKIPSDKEINEKERELAAMKEAKARATEEAVQVLSSDAVINSLRPDQLLGLMRKLQVRLQGGHKRRRGSPVPDTLRLSLEIALRRGDKSLSELSDMLGLSVSYISRVKKEMKDKGELGVLNAYEDQQLTHQKANIHELQPA